MENTYCLSAPEQRNCPSSPYKDRKVLVPTCKGRDHAAIVKEGGRELWKRRIDRIMWIRKKKKKERRNKTCWTEETPLCPKRMSHYQEGGQTQTAFPPSHHPLRLWRWSGSSQTRLKIDSRGRRIFRVQTLFLCDLPDLHFFFCPFLTLVSLARVCSWRHCCPVAVVTVTNKEEKRKWGETATVK